MKPFQSTGPGAHRRTAEIRRQTIALVLYQGGVFLCGAAAAWTASAAVSVSAWPLLPGAAAAAVGLFLMLVGDRRIRSLP